MQTESPAERVIEDLRIEIFRRNLSQEKLAILTGISTSAISRRLTNRTSSTVPELIKLANAVDADIHISLVPRSTPTARPVDDLPPVSAGRASSPSKDAA